MDAALAVIAGLAGGSVSAAVAGLAQIMIQRMRDRQTRADRAAEERRQDAIALRTLHAEHQVQYVRQLTGVLLFLEQEEAKSAADHGFLVVESVRSDTIDSWGEVVEALRRIEYEHHDKKSRDLASIVAYKVRNYFINPDDGEVELDRISEWRTGIQEVLDRTHALSVSLFATPEESDGAS